jgi:hypothetical protein
LRSNRPAVSRSGSKIPKPGSVTWSSPEDVYNRLQALFDDADFDVKETYPLVWQVMKEDWEDPSMDVYDTDLETI